MSIPISLLSEITVDQASLLARSVDNLLAAGWAVNLPGIEQGENVAEIGYVARREKYNTNDGSTTPIIDLYENKDPQRGGAFKLIHLYLNTAEDVAAFESACGITLSQIPLYEADAAIERGKGKDKYVLALRAPAKLVWKLNPRYEGKDDKKNAKRLFVRWHSHQPAGQLVGKLKADPATGEVLGEPTGTEEVQYLVGSKELADLIGKETGLKPPAFMPLLTASGAKSVTLARAKAIISAGINK